MIKKIAVTAAATLAATAAAGLAVAAPAHADSYVYATSAGSCAGVSFDPVTEVFGFKDFCADGRGVWMQYTTPMYMPSTNDPKHVKSFATSYDGSYSWSSRGVVYWDTSITEDKCLYYRVGLRANGQYVSGTFGSWQIACA
jgi:hypothetical protein